MKLVNHSNCKMTFHLFKKNLHKPLHQSFHLQKRLILLIIIPQFKLMEILNAKNFIKLIHCKLKTKSLNYKLKKKSLNTKYYLKTLIKLKQQ